jgi:signal transduction histidine kinase/DNA-binding response OmpR family regulator
MRQLLSINLLHDQDVVAARQRAAHISQLLGFDVSEQTRIATAVSEIVRNAFRYARGASVAFSIDADDNPQRLVVKVTDKGPGIANLDDVLSGRYRSSTGMGLGIVGARRLMDRFTIESCPAGTTVILEKTLSARQEIISSPRATYIAEAVARKRPDSLIEEIQHQNQELLRALDELQRKQQELVRLNRELEDTNRGVVALYAELDDKADHLRRADELKSRFLSNMTHEFRTPVNSILGLSNLLLEDLQRDGREPLPEVVYIRQAAEQLSELVNDLLDLAKVEAGKTVVRPAEFEVNNVFGALRGMLRPLLLNQSVALVFEDVAGLPPLYTDEGKLSQILRNLLSNALKFTERGEVRVAASVTEDGSTMVFDVTDTGIGIAAEDQSRIFEEFTQVEHRLQRHVRGTGLGLPLSKKLAELLGGTLTVRSEPGFGSTFTLTIPRRYRIQRLAAPEIRWTAESGRLPMLIVEDAADALYLYEKVLRGSAFEIVPAATVEEADAILERISPAIIVLDLVLGGDHTWEFLGRLRRDPRTRAIPVLVVSSAPERDRALSLGADAFLSKPIDRRSFVTAVRELQDRQVTPVHVLSIDDEEAARYLLRQCLPAPAFHVTEAPEGETGLRLARDEQPDLVLLDLFMPGLHGMEVLQRLRNEPVTRDIPVIIVTSQALDRDERDRLLRNADAIVSKAGISRDSLAAEVRAALDRRTSRPEDPGATPSPLSSRVRHDEPLEPMEPLEPSEPLEPREP